MTDFAGANRLKDIPITKTQRSKKQQTWWTWFKETFCRGRGWRLQSNCLSQFWTAAVHRPCHLQQSGHFQPVLRYSVKPNLWEIPGYFWISGFLGFHQHVTGCSNLLNLWIGCNTEFCILAFPSSPLVQQRRKKKAKKMHTSIGCVPSLQRRNRGETIN